MPRMTQKRKQELALFLNERGRVEYNSLCRRCVHNYKQAYRVLVIVGSTVIFPTGLSKRMDVESERTVLPPWRC